MTERILPGIGLTGFWDQGAPWKVGGDQNWLRSSVLTQLAVESATTSLPASPLNGVIYIVPVGDANANQVAARDNGAWVFMPPQEGWTAYVRDTGVLMNFDGAAWVPSTAPLAAPTASASLGYLKANATPTFVQNALRDLEAAYQGMKVKIVAGVLRNYGTPGAPDWQLIQDANHTKMNCGTVVMNGTKLQLNFAGVYKSAISFIVGPDETLAAQGFTAGASVGTGNVLIECGQKMQGYVNLTGGFVTLNNPTYWAGADITASVAASGIVTITHPSNGGFEPVVFVKEPGSPYRLPTFAVKQIDATHTSIHPYRQLGGYVRYFGGVWSVFTSTVAGCSVAESGGTVTVTHPAVNALTPAMISPRFNSTVLAMKDTEDTTFFTVKFVDFSGAQVTTPTNDMRFSFTRGDFLPAGAAVNGEAYFDLGYGSIDMGKLVVLGGNLWFIGVFEDF